MCKRKDGSILNTLKKTWIRKEVRENMSALCREGSPWCTVTLLRRELNRGLCQCGILNLYLYLSIYRPLFLYTRSSLHIAQWGSGERCPKSFKCREEYGDWKRLHCPQPWMLTVFFYKINEEWNMGYVCCGILCTWLSFLPSAEFLTQLKSDLKTDLGSLHCSLTVRETKCFL